jgi:hypothetical protein
MDNLKLIKSFFILCALTLFIFSCSRTKENQIHQKASGYIVDNNFSELDYKSFCDDIEKAEEKVSLELKTAGKADPSKVISFIEKIAKEKNIQLSFFWKPNLESNKLNKFNYNVYLENSASMDGYVNGTSQFKNDIYNFLADLRLNDTKDSLNLYYINRSLIPQKKNAADDDLKDFIERLSPETFQSKGGNRGVSDMASLIGEVLDRVDEKNVGILISDFVFSPGRNTDVVNRLINQQTAIKMKFGGKLKKYQLSVAIFQLESEFVGKYYDMSDNVIALNGIMRPYYVWVIGTPDQVKKMSTENLFEFQNHVKNRWIIESSNSNNQLNDVFEIEYKDRVGEFNKEVLLKDKKKGKWTIADAEYPKGKDEKVFQFTVHANFTTGLQNKEYFSNPSIYSIDNPNYKLTSVDTIKDFELKKSFSHQLKFTTTNLKSEKINLSIKKYITPIWVNNISSSNDCNILNDSTEQRKTYGYNYLIEGMKDGFDVDSKSKKPVLEVEIRIKQTSYKWIGLLIFILLTVVAFLFVLRKYKK